MCHKVSSWSSRFHYCAQSGEIHRAGDDCHQETAGVFLAEVFKYSTVVFTDGDQLPDRMSIEEFVTNNKPLKDLVDKCGGRCHVVDNKYWKNQQDKYRNNQFQVTQLVNTIENMLMENEGGGYTTEMLKDWQRQQEERTKPSSLSASLHRVYRLLTKYTTKKSVKVLVGVAVIVGALLFLKTVTTSHHNAAVGM